VRSENDLQKCRTSVRKNVEHTFDVLHAQWGMMHYPTWLWSETIMKFGLKLVVIMHNMVVENEEEDVKLNLDFWKQQTSTCLEQY
jgi:hypothetical protein